MNKIPLHIIVADDHALVREGTKLLLDDTFTMVQTVENGEQALELSAENNPDIVLLDLNMVGMGGIEATRRILRLGKNIKILICSAFNAAPFPMKLMEIGAHGYSYKDISKNNLVNAIQLICDGHVYLDPRIARDITISRFNDDKSNPFSDLTTRELQISVLLINAVPVGKIAKFLSISPKTVCGYRYALFDKLDIDSDVELTHLAYRHRLMSDIAPIQQL